MVTTETVQDPQSGLQEEYIESQTADVFSLFKGGKDELIPILQKTQQKFGYLPEPAMKKIAKFTHIPESTIFGVATFYAQFKLVPLGRNVIKVCRGTACYVRGGAEILQKVEERLGIKAGETTPDFEYSIETIACFGSCALAPVVVVNDKVYGKMNVSRVDEILEACKETS
ncbi:MAG: NADH-quinone oxidoreductase subunit NuoE [Desulfobacterales bacterium]|nr:NADH-quinone oxidoreductase subunit NuoE [Desulfobacterales bacterium]